MNVKEKFEEMHLVHELMKANSSFDVAQFETIVKDLEVCIGESVDRDDEHKMESEFFKNMQKALLKALEGNADATMIGIAEQILTQAGGEYRSIKSKFMNDIQQTFLAHLGQEDESKDNPMPIGEKDAGKKN